MHPLIPAGGNARLQPQCQRERKSEQKKDSLKRDQRQTAVFPNRVVLKQGNGKWDHSKNKQKRDKKCLLRPWETFRISPSNAQTYISISKHAVKKMLRSSITI